MQMEELHQMVCIDQLNQTANKTDFFSPIGLLLDS